MDTMKDTKMQPAKDAVINELRMLAEDLYVNGYNRYSLAMLTAADRLEAAEKELAELRSSMKFRTSLIGRTEAERDALRAKLEAAESDAAHQKSIADSALRVANGWERKCDELRAKVEQMERQKPAGKFIQHPSNGLWEQDGYGDNPDARPLYALPGAKGEEK